MSTRSRGSRGPGDCLPSHLETNEALGLGPPNGCVIPLPSDAEAAVPVGGDVLDDGHVRVLRPLCLRRALLIVLLLPANDFVTVSLAVDHATPSPRPERWRIGAVVGAALSLAAVVLAESFLDLWLSRGMFGLSWSQTQTVIFLMLVFSGQATVYVVRERGHFWKSRPVRWLLAATIGDVVVISALAVGGVLMTPVGIGYVALTLAIAGAFMLVMDPVKVSVLRRFGLA